MCVQIGHYKGNFLGIRIYGVYQMFDFCSKKYKQKFEN